MKLLARALAIVALVCTSHLLQAQTQGEVGSYPNATALTGNERILADQAATYPCTNCTVNLTPAQISSYLLGSGSFFPTYSTGYLNWNGTALQWSTPSSTGTVTSVGLSMPIGFSVSPSTITTSGTFNVTTSLSGVLKGSSGSIVTAAASDVISLWTGTCSAGTYLGGNGACSTPVGTVSTTGSPASGNLAQFSGATSLTNGNLSGDCTTSGTLAITCTKTAGTAFAASATTNTTVASNITSGTLPAGRMPALTGDCTTSAGAVATTCTKTNGTAFGTFATANVATPPVIGGTTPAAGTFTTLTSDALANNYGLVVVGSATSGQSLGAVIDAGTTSADAALLIRNQGVTQNFLEVWGDGGTVLGSATGGDKGLGTVNATGYYVNGVAVGGGNVGSSGTPTAGQFAEWVNSTNIAGETMGGDCTLAIATITCTKTNGTAFGTFAIANAATPPAIGSTTPAAGSFTSLTSTGGEVNSKAGAASSPAFTLSGAPYTGGTGTTTFPLLYVNAGTAPTTFSTAGTELGFNAPSGYTGNFLDARVNGGSAVCTLNYQGNFTCGTYNGTTIPSSATLLVNGGALGTPSSATLTNATGLPFSGLTTGSLSAGTMTVASGASLTYSGTGVVNANQTGGVAFGTFATANAATPPAIGGTTPNVGIFTTLTADPAAGSYGETINATTTSGQSYGIRASAGTTGSDWAEFVTNAANTQNLFIVRGDGGVVVGSPTGGDEGLGTINATGYYINGVAVGSGNVGTTGTPVTGNLAAFSSASTITTGNLSGDCTTSGTLAVTCTKTSGTAFGTFATQNYATPPTIGATTPNSAYFTTVRFNPPANTYGIGVVGSSTTGQSFGEYIEAGTNSSDRALEIYNQSASTAYEVVWGDGGITVGSPTGGDKGLGSLNAQALYVNGVTAVSTTGSPATGNLTQFTGAGTISNGNLSGDCTTSDSLGVTCTKTNGAAFGTFATANAATPPAIGGTTPAAGAFTTLSSTGPANTYADTVHGSSTSGQSYGLNVLAGTTAVDSAITIANQANTLTFLSIKGNGSGSLGAGLTWSTLGGIAITPSSGNALTANSSSNNPAGIFNGGSTTGQSKGVSIVAGTNSSDYALLMTSNGGATLGEMHGDGGVTLGTPTGGDIGAGTINATGVYINGVAVNATSNYAYGYVTSACLLNQSKNMSCGTHTTGSGIYDMSVTGFASTPFCQVSANGHAFSSYVLASSTTTTVVVATYDSTGANADEAFSVICFQ